MSKFYTLPCFLNYVLSQCCLHLRLRTKLFLVSVKTDQKKNYSKKKDSCKHNSVKYIYHSRDTAPLSQRQTSNGMTKPILYHKTHTAWQKSYCMSFAMPSYFPWIHGKTHVISAPPYPWLFPCSNLSLVSQLFAFDSTF